MNQWSINLLYMGLGLLSIALWSGSTKVQDKEDQKETMLCLSGRVIKGEIIDDGSDLIRVKLSLGLDIKNLGPQPALLLRREPVVIERTINSASSHEADKSLYSLVTLPSIENSWKNLQERFDRPAPPLDAIRVLAPGETWMIVKDEWFTVSKKGNEDSKPWNTVREASPLSLQLRLQMWSRDIEPYSELDKLKFSRKLQHRWRGVGNLRLEDLTSDWITLDLSSFITRKAAP